MTVSRSASAEARRARARRCGEHYVTAPIDDRCGTPHRRFPWPAPRLSWAGTEINALDHLVLAGALQSGLSSGIGGYFAEAVKSGIGKLVQTAIGQLRA